MTVECRWPTAATAAVVPVSLLVGFLRDGAGDTAFAQVGAESSGAVGPVGDDLVGCGAGTSTSGPRNPDPFQEGTRADAVVALARRQQERERALTWRQALVDWAPVIVAAVDVLRSLWS